MFGKKREANAPGSFELKQAEVCRHCATLAIAEGDRTHALVMEEKAKDWESKAQEAVRKDREERAGVYDTTF